MSTRKPLHPCSTSFFPLFIASLVCLACQMARATDPFVFVCRDAGAGGYQAFPDITRLKDGRLMVVFYAGYTHVSLPSPEWPRGGCIAFCLSSDEGASWSPPQTLYDGPEDDRDPSIVQLRDGRLLCNYFSLRRKGVGDQYEGLGSWVVSSSDQGRTWSEPQCLAKDYYCSSPIRQLSRKRLILGLYRETGSTAAGAVVLSQDGGKTWGRPVDIDNGGERLDAETDLISLKDGRLMAIQRAPSKSMGVSYSSDQGRSWTVSKAIGFPGHSPYLLRARGDILLLAHRLPQTSLHYSRDEGRSWFGPVQVDDFIGAYPSMVNLKDGSVLVVYYEEGNRSGIRARRFRAGSAGIQWLPCGPSI
jgi:sialidase-1